MNYILKDGVPVKCDDVLKWAKEFKKSDRIIAQDELGGVRVSTVFIGIDHGLGFGKPLLFETMIFGGEHDEYQERYSTIEKAKEGHKKALSLVEPYFY